MKGLLCVIGIACLYIFYQFNALPAHLTFDEVEFARLAVMLEYSDYTPYTQYATGHATMYFYIILAFFKLFGLHEASLRLPSALFGVLAGGMMYLVAREVFGVTKINLARWGRHTYSIGIALVVGLLFVSMRWMYGFARFSFEGTLVLFLELVSLYGLVRAMKEPKRWMWLVVSALGAGLAFNSYQVGRFFFLIPLVGMFVPPSLRKIRSYVLFLSVFGVLIAPLSVYLLNNHDVRVAQQLYLQDPNLSLSEKVVFFGDNVWRNTKLFFVEGDASGRHNYPFKPALPLPITLLAVWGCVLCIRDWRKPYRILILLYGVLAMGPTLLTYPHENPNMLRTITVIPSLVLCVGYALEYIASKSSRAVVGGICALVVALSVIADARTYFVFQREVFPQAFEVKDRFGGVYFFMKERGYDINRFTIPNDQIEKFYSVPGPSQSYRNQ